MSNSLFSNFPPSAGNWEQLVEAELKKPGAAQTLGWHTEENFSASPYHQNYLNPEVSQLADSIAAIMRKPENTEFYNYQLFNSADPTELSRKIQAALNGGVNGLVIFGDHDAEAFNKALNGAMTEYLWLELVANEPEKAALHLTERLLENGVDSFKQFGAICYSPLQELIETGKQGDMDRLKSHVMAMNVSLPSMKAVLINASVIANGGGNLTQQIAFALSQGNEYLNWASEQGLNLEEFAAQLNFHFSTGTNFLLESVKIRSFKWLWSLVLKEYGINNTLTFVSSCTSTIGSSVYDSHNNLLRYTTATMAAIISGSDAHTVLPFDSEYRKASDFSERISRNITNLLLEESFLGKVENVTYGSYAFDNLQYLLCKDAWALFNDWEAAGGFMAAANSGKIKAAVKVSADALQAKFADNKLVVLGVNKYPNKGESKKADWTQKPAAKLNSDIAIDTFRLAEVSELERLGQE